MKTAMQELIEYLEVRDRKFTYTYKKAIELLEKEKEQIIEAYDKGISDHQWNDYNPEEYYNQTYNQYKELPKDVKDMLDNL